MRNLGLADFIGRLQTHNMMAIVTLFDFYASDASNAYSAGPYAADKQHIHTVINALGATNPTVMAWDIKNELDRDYPLPIGEAAVKAWANEMINYTRQLDPNHLITIGFFGVTTGTLCYDPAVTNVPVYDPALAAEFAPAVDFVSMHYYLSERCFESDVQALQTLIGDKPLVLEEFGLHTLSDSSFPDPHTETEQAAYYNALLSLSEAHGLAGTSFWTLNDLSYILAALPESERCLGILRNQNVDVCQTKAPSDYSEKPAAATVRRHYEHHVAYLDLFDSWVDPNVDAPPAGWADNWREGGAILRGYNPDQLLWSHHPGHVAFSKFVTNGISITGLATSPVLTGVNVDRSPFLAGQVSSYAVRDVINGSNSILHIGVREDGQITRLLTITPDMPLPYSFRLDLRRSPTAWSGARTFQVVFELVSEGEGNGYSATYEFDWIALQGHALYLPLIVNENGR